MRIIKILCLIVFTGFSAFSYSFDKVNLERANQFALKYIVAPTFKVKPINLKKVLNKIKFELMGETLIEISGCKSDVVKKYYNNKFSNCMMKNKRIITIIK